VGESSVREDPVYGDKLKQREIRHILDDVGFCGCGSSDKYEILKGLLERAVVGGRFDEPLGDAFSGRAVEFIADVMSSSHWDLLDHGTSLGGSWLTERGKVLLQFFQDFGANAEGWPGWWCSVEVGEEW